MTWGPSYRPGAGGVRGHEKVPVYGQVEVLAGGQLEVPIPRSSCRPGLSGLSGDGGGVSQSPSPPRELLLKSARDRMDIVSAYREAGTFRGAAAISGTTPKTVRRVIARHEAGGGTPVRVPRGHNYDAVAALVAGRVARTSARISAKRLLPAARAAGYAGSPRNFRRLVAAAKAGWREDHHRGRRPAVWSPGEYLVIDWGSAGGLHVFCAVLAWC